MREHLDTAIALDDAAEELATSKRTLTRRLNEVLGKTPVEYIQDLRVERVVHLLKTSKLSVDRIAEQVGYADGVMLRTLLRRRIGKGAVRRGRREPYRLLEYAGGRARLIPREALPAEARGRMTASR